MMLDAFDILINMLLLHSDQAEELLQQLMAVNQPFSYFLPLLVRTSPRYFS